MFYLVKKIGYVWCVFLYYLPRFMRNFGAHPVLCTRDETTCALNWLNVCVREWVHTCSDLSERRWTPKATMLSQMYIKSVTGFQRTCMYKIYMHTNIIYIMYKNEYIRLDCLAKTQDMTWGKTGCNQVKFLAGHFSIMLKKNTAEDDLACKDFLEELRLLLTHQVLLAPDT